MRNKAALPRDHTAQAEIWLHLGLYHQAATGHLRLALWFEDTFAPAGQGYYSKAQQQTAPTRPSQLPQPIIFPQHSQHDPLNTNSTA